MEQIAIEADYFNVLAGVGWMPNFTGTFFISSDGKVSLNHDVLNLNSADIDYWNRMGKSKKSVQGLNFGLAGESFLITNDDSLDIAVPFFEKHLSIKHKP